MADNWYVPARLAPEMNALFENPMLAIPKDVFQHRAVSYTAEHRPFSEVVETYQAELLAFRR